MKELNRGAHTIMIEIVKQSEPYKNHNTSPHPIEAERCRVVSCHLSYQYSFSHKHTPFARLCRLATNNR